MFTKDDYATLTASQRKGRIRKTIAKHIAVTIVTTAAVYALCDKVEAKLDSRQN